MESTFLEYYKFPLKIDQVLNDINNVDTFDDERAFDFNEELIFSNISKRLVVSLLNNGITRGNIFTDLNLRQEEEIVYLDGIKFITIRGWAHLTGINGLNLLPDQAKEIQNQFAKYIVDKLKAR